MAYEPVNGAKKQQQAPEPPAVAPPAPTSVATDPAYQLVNGAKKQQQAPEPPAVAPPAPTSVATDPAYQLARIQVTKELDLGNGITDAIQPGAIYDIKKVGTVFEVRQKNRDSVFEIYPSMVGVVVWTSKPDAQGAPKA